MPSLKFGSAGVTAQEIDLSGPVAVQPQGVPAGIIGTALKGPAFVPVTVGILSDFYAKFGLTDGKSFGPLAVTEWLRNAAAVVYLRVLGCGNGLQRNLDGSVTSGGFTVGENEPNVQTGTGALFGNPYANSGSLSVPGRTYFLGAFMSESFGSTVFSSAGLQGPGSITPGITSSLPIVRGVLMAPSGVIMRLSSSAEGTNAAPASNLVATDGTANGKLMGSVVLMNGSTPKQDFVLLLNGHQGLDPRYPNVITASFDMTSPNYFGNVLNTDPLLYQQAGHYLYSHWDVHPAVAAVTGSGIVYPVSGAGGTLTELVGTETAAFLTTGSTARNTGATDIPNYESWVDRFEHALSPWLISQKFGGKPSDLFRLHALDDGTGISTNFKLSIENITPSTDPSDKFGSFDLVVRDWNDNDTNVVYLEQWRGVNLDPSDDRYIAKVIGDTNVFYNFDQVQASQKIFVDGNYPNSSNLIRVEVSDAVNNGTVDPTALPFGFRGISHLLTSGSSPLTSPTSTQVQVSSILKRAIELPLPMRGDMTQGTGVKLLVSPLLYWGTRFEHITDLTMPNASTLQNQSLQAFAAWYPDFATTNQSFVVGDNTGVADTAANGVLDSDRFCSNLFTLENIQVVTASSGLADSQQWVNATYVRNGNINANDTNKTRRISASDMIQANRRFLKFTLPMQGGFDGVNIFDPDEATIDNAAVVADMFDSNRGLNVGPNVTSYTKALDIMTNVTNVDIMLLAIPGIRHPIVTDYATSTTEDRFDALYIMDIEELDNNGDNVVSDDQLASVTNTAQQFSDRALDSSFAAAYFPDVVLPDPNTGTNVVAPPSVAVLGALALNDAIGYPWFAPAGFTRGALSTTLEAKVKLSKSNMDTLYDVNINPLVAFPGNATSGTNPKGGVVVWGQKTLQVAASALDRVNVRRLLIDIRRNVRDIAQTIIFEPNRATTLAKFSAAVTPVLQRVQALAGLNAYKVVIDSSTTTQADILNNTLRGRIFLQPTRSIEFVSLSFIVSNNAGQSGP